MTGCSAWSPGRRSASVVSLALLLGWSSLASAERTIYEVAPSSGSVVVDGVLDEPAWSQARVVELRYETRPGENVEPPVRTECLLMYDEGSFYAGFRAFDDRPEEIRARFTDRDSAFSDDFVGVVLDTFDDERRAFEFFINPLGVQMDMFLDDTQGSEDSSWDAIWESAGRITSEGYVVEIRIPFSSLRFPRTDQVQTWGIDILRFYPRDLVHRIASQPLSRGRNCYLCQASRITGLQGMTPGRNLELNPTFTAGYGQRRVPFPDGDFESEDLDTDPGLTVSWGLTPSMNLNTTLNPDFSQVEADSAQLDVNTRFALFFPEKRPFFLEGADFFNTPMNILFTRNVADPNWGVKLTGKEGGNALGVFLAQDDLTNLLLPGSQGSGATTLDEESLDGAIRYRRDVGDNSTLGVLATARHAGDYGNDVIALDGTIRMGESDSIDVQVAGSSTEYPDAVVQESGQPDGVFPGLAGLVEYEHSGRDWSWYAVYEHRGREFRADMGFVPQVDTRFLLGGVNRFWHGEDDDWYQRITVGADWDQLEDTDGTLLEREVEAWFSFQGPLQSFFNFDFGTRDRTFEGVPFFDQPFVNVYFEMTPSATWSGGISANLLEGIDFANVQPADAIFIEPWVNLKFGRRFSLNLSQVYQRLDVEGGQLFTAGLTRVRAVYQFNRRSFLRAIVQYRDVERAPELYEDAVEPREKSLASQVLFSYKLNARTVLFVGYSDDRLADAEIGLTQEGWRAFLKLGYAWVL